MLDPAVAVEPIDVELELVPAEDDDALVEDVEATDALEEPAEPTGTHTLCVASQP